MRTMRQFLALIFALALATLLVAGSLAAGTGAALAKGGGGGGGHNGGGSNNHGDHNDRGGSGHQGTGAKEATKNQLRRCLGYTCGFSKTIDSAYKKVKVW